VISALICASATSLTVGIIILSKVYIKVIKKVIIKKIIMVNFNFRDDFIVLLLYKCGIMLINV